jgi:hypothetical protein
MKKLLMSSVVLIAFSLAIIVFQMSCKKDANAQTAQGGITQLNKLIFFKNPPPFSSLELWKCNYDGSNALKINVNLGAGVVFGKSAPVFSPDGKKIFFTAGKPNLPDQIAKDVTLCSCNSDGSEMAWLPVTGNGGSIDLGGAY